MKRKWWHEKVAYQIYPKSFKDSNGDGIGDLPGIISKLDYLQELGIEILWISPIYCSPLADQGYDISDYYGIDPRFGTMEDMEVLIAEAKKRGIHILMDLVVNHCSDEHIWFQKACQDPDGKYGKYFYIEDVKEEPPCNWRSYFGGGVWDKLPGHPDKYYLHVFHKKQPDLNWENPELREEVYKMVNWWLEKGISGFRIDAIINIKKTDEWKSYPADREDGLCDIQNMLEEANGIGEFLGELRDRCFDPYNAFTVGEVFNEKENELEDYIGDHGYFSTKFDFDPVVWGKSSKGWYDMPVIHPDAYRDCLYKTQTEMEGKGFVANIIENHDEPRGVSHYLNTEDVANPKYSLKAKKMLATLMFSLKGLPFLYQGQEIGMENVPFTSIDQIDDIHTIDQYQVALDAGFSEEEALQVIRRFSRDNSRTPFQWDASTEAGFTNGSPWLAVNPNYPTINLESQRQDPDSLYSYYRKLIALRKNPEYKETMVYGIFEPIEEKEHNLISFHRKGDDQTLLIILNYQKETRTFTLPHPCKKVLLSNVDMSNFDPEQISLKLEGYQAVIFEV
ncbi:MAG: alpha-glucosidase [Eubacteriales bacterium]|nr:alpha-glucosidase [Eubacteriales bacterium]